MKKTVLTLLLSLCLIGTVLIFSAQADQTLQISVAPGEEYTTVEAALAAVEKMAKKGELSTDGVRLVLSGTHTATVKDGLLFGQKTVFLPDGTKLPITVTGGTLLFPEGSIACANDYTFRSIKVNLDDSKTDLFAGSGEITLEEITLDQNENAEYLGRFFADTFTAKVFDGWTEEQLAKYCENGLFRSSLTLGEGFVYNGKSGRIAAVGASGDFEAKIGGKTLTAKDTVPCLIIDGATLHDTMVRIGSNPAGDSRLLMKSGTIRHLYGGGHGFQTKLTGNMTVTVEGGSLTSYPRILREVTLKGDLTVSLSNFDLLGNTDTDGCMIELGFGKCILEGDLKVLLNNVKADRFWTFFGSSSQLITGDVSVTAENCVFTKRFESGSGSTVCGNIRNELKNCTVGAFYRGAGTALLVGDQDRYTGSAAEVGNVTNLLEDVTFTEPEGTEVAASYAGAFKEGSIITGNIRSSLLRVHFSNRVIFVGGSNPGTSGRVQGNIENTVTDSVFDDAYYGGMYYGTAEGSITNRIQGGSFGNFYYGGNQAGNVIGDVENDILGGEWLRHESVENFFFGGSKAGTVNGCIRNRFRQALFHMEIYGGNKSGTVYDVRNRFESGTYHNYVYLAGYGGSLLGTVENHIEGGDFDQYYTFGGLRSGTFKPPVDVAYGVRNYISGGSFRGFWGGGANGSLIHQGNIYNEITGGDFQVYSNKDTKYNSFAGGCRNAPNGGNVVTLIRGGNFKGYVFGGNNPNDESMLDHNPGSTKLILAGGSFLYPVSADSRYGSYASTSLVIDTEKALEPLVLKHPTVLDSITLSSSAPTSVSGELSADRVITSGTGLCTLYASLSCKEFSILPDAKGPAVYGSLFCELYESNSVLELGLRGSVTAERVVGRAILHQRDHWLAETYFTAPADTVFVLSQAEGCIGTAECSEGKVWGSRSALAGVSFVFSDKVSLRFAFDAALTEAVREEFTFKATLGGKTIVDADFSDLVKTGDYYTVLSVPMNVATMAPEGTVEGTLVAKQDLSLYELLETAVTVYGTDPDYELLISLIKGFSNYYTAGRNTVSGESASLPYENAHFPTGFEAGAGPLELESDIATLTSRKLLLNDGMYIRYYGNLKAKGYSKKLSVTYGCEDITASCNLTEYADRTFSFDIPVYPSKAQSYIRLILRSGDSVVFDFVDRLDTVVEGLAAQENSRLLAESLLYYLQSGAEYYRSQPSLKGFTPPDTFSAGYAREDFSPYGFEMNMYGEKIGKVVLDPVEVTCLALWDGKEMALIFGMDVRGVSDTVTAYCKKLLAEDLRDFPVDPDKIFFNATHTHSGPDIGVRTSESVLRWYDEYFDDALSMAARKAIRDLAPTTAYSGAAMSDPGTNFVRRYKRNNADGKGEYTGIHNIVPSTNIIGYESEADKEMRTVRFDREGKKDILMVNWQGHAAHGANIYAYQMTADLVGELRTGVEKDLDVHFIYINGASGNLNFSAKLGEKYFKANDFYAVGRSLVGTAKKSVAAEAPIELGELEVTYIPYLAKTKREEAATVEKAKLCLADYSAKTFASSSAERSYIQKNYGFQSRYEVSSIIARSTLAEELVIPLWAFSFGDVGMAFAPYEMFDTNGMQIRAGSGHRVTLISAYSNGSRSYIPSSFAEPHSGYEVYTSRYVNGTGDALAAALAAALTAHTES